MVWEFGSDIKLQIKVSGSGFNQSEDSYIVTIYNGDSILEFNSANLVCDGEGNYYLPITAEQLVPGPLVMVVSALVPDSDFANGFRREVAPPVKLGIVKEPPVATK